jgi:hypothetical protein
MRASPAAASALAQADALAPGAAAPSPAGAEGRLEAAIALGLAALVLAVYWGAGRLGFVAFDDGLYVTENAVVRRGLTWDGVAWAFTSFHASNWHPLTWLSHMADVQLFGDGPAWMHRVNVAWHLAGVALLFLVLRRATGAVWRSALVAALFAVHPLNVESVAWVAERKNVVSTFLWIATIGLYVRHTRRPGVRSYAAVAACFALGLLAKPMLVTLPVVLLLLDVWPLGRVRADASLWRSAPRLVAEKVPLFLLSAASSAATLIAQDRAFSTVDALPLATRLAHAAVAYGWYLEKTFWPAGLCAFYPHAAWRPGGLPAGAVLASAGLLAAVTAFAVRQRRSRPWIAVGWGWVLVTLLPVIGILQVGLQGTADRYAHVPIMGVLFAVVWSLPDLRARPAGARRAALAGAAMALAALAGAARAQVATWRDDEALFTRAVEVVPGNWLGWKNLGALRFRQGRHAEAEGAFATALRSRPWDPDLWYDLAALASLRGDLAAAAANLEKALALAPDDDESWVRLGETYAVSGRHADLARLRARLAVERPAASRALEARLRPPAPRSPAP